MSDNLKIWDAVCETNPDNVKRVNQRGGFSAIDAYSQIHAATKQFGPVGVGWGWDIENVQYPPNDTVVVHIVMWHGNRNDKFCVTGQKKLNGKPKDNGEINPDEDAFKKAMTDAITKGLSYLGFNADVFLGYFDDSKYVERMKQKNSDPKKGNVTAAKKAFQNFIDEVYACDDEDTLDAYINDGKTKKLIARFHEVIPELANGDGSSEMCGIDGMIGQRRKYIKENTNV